jgi:phosphotransferase system, enzyme I, PtsP
MLNILRQIIQEVSSAQHFNEALEIMVSRIAHALATHACSVFLLDRHRSEYVLVATQGLNPEAVGKVKVPIDMGLIGLVGEREEPINLDDASTHPRFYHVEAVKEDPYRAFLGTPIIYHRQVLGVLIVQQKETRRYDESEEAFLVTLGTQLASIIAHAESTGALNELFAVSPKKNERVCNGAAGGSWYWHGNWRADLRAI